MIKTISILTILVLFVEMGGAVVNADSKPGVIPKDPKIVLDNPEFVSPVPKYTFPTTLNAQKKALADNPLLKTIRNARLTEYGHEEQFRPDYHFSAAYGGIGDPNGFCYWKGNYHLFYQGFPPEVLDAMKVGGNGVHWGHAFSKDMIHWEDLPFAIHPNPEAACFSGSTLVEEDRVIAAYHGTQIGNMIAVSSDPLLLNWEKVEGTSVMPSRTSGVGIFDPCIWREGDTYYSLSGIFETDTRTGLRDMRHYLFSSKDLREWIYLHPFLENDVFTPLGEDGACPYFWPIGDKYMLIHFSHDNGPSCLIGDYDKERDKFTVLNHVRLSSGIAGGGGTHAPSAFPDGKGNVMLIMNMSTAKGTTFRGKAIMGHVMTLPMTLSLRDHKGLDRHLDLGFEPVEEAHTLRAEVLDEFTALRLPKGEEVVLDHVSGDAIEIEVEMDVRKSVELNVLRSPGGEEVTRVVFYRDAGRTDWRVRMLPENRKVGRSFFDSLVSIDTTQSTTLPNVATRAPETVPVYLDRNEPLTLRVFVDKSMVEVFANGKAYVAMRVYPQREDSIGVSLKAHRVDATVKKFTAWKMKNIWRTNGEE